MKALDSVPDVPARKALARPRLQKRVVLQLAESQTEKDAAGMNMSPRCSEPASPGKVPGVQIATADFFPVGNLLPMSFLMTALSLA